MKSIYTYADDREPDDLKADYKDIDPLYGKLEDVDELIRELKKRDMKLMMDLVVNHTSDQVCSRPEGFRSTVRLICTAPMVPGL